MNCLQYVTAAWLPNIIFPQTMAPSFRKCCFSGIPFSYLVRVDAPWQLSTDVRFFEGYGFPATFGFVIAGIITIIITQLLVLRERRRGKASSSSLEQGSRARSDEEGREESLEQVVAVCPEKKS